MENKIEKMKKISITILSIVVSILVIYAIFANRERFYNPETVRYDRITIGIQNDIEKVLSEYSTRKNKDRLISEIKKINNLETLSDETVYGKTIYIPVTKN